MIKRLFSIIAVVLICVSSPLLASAYTDGYVVDNEFAEEYFPEEIYEEYLPEDIYEEYYFDEEYEPIEKPSKARVPFIWLPISLAIGLVIGFLIIKSIASKNNSVKMQKNATVYERSGSMAITSSADKFLHCHIDRRPKPKQPNKK